MTAIFAMTDEFRILCDEILGSSPRMTENARRDFYRHPQHKLGDDIEVVGSGDETILW